MRAINRIKVFIVSSTLPRDVLSERFPIVTAGDSADDAIVLVFVRTIAVAVRSIDRSTQPTRTREDYRTRYSLA